MARTSTWCITKTKVFFVTLYVTQYQKDVKDFLYIV